MFSILPDNTNEDVLVKDSYPMIKDVRLGRSSHKLLYDEKPERMKESTFKNELSSIVRVSNLGRSIMIILLYTILDNSNRFV